MELRLEELEFQILKYVDEMYRVLDKILKELILSLLFDPYEYR